MLGLAKIADPTTATIDLIFTILMIGVGAWVFFDTERVLKIIGSKNTNVTALKVMKILAGIVFIGALLSVIFNPYR